MLTAVPTGVPSRLYVISKTAHCPTNGSRVCVASFIALLPPYLSLCRYPRAQEVCPSDLSVSLIRVHQRAFADRTRRPSTPVPPVTSSRGGCIAGAPLLRA